MIFMGVTGGSALGVSIGTSEIELSSISTALLQQKAVATGNIALSSISTALIQQDAIIGPLLGSGTIKLVLDTTLLASSQTISIVGLDGNADKHYVLFVQLLNAAGSTSTISLRPNALTSSMSSSLLKTETTTISALFQTSLSLAIINGSNSGAFTANIFPSTGLKRFYTSHASRYSAGAELGVQVAAGAWTDENMNITSLDIFHNSAPGFGIGTKIQLYKAI